MNTIYSAALALARNIALKLVKIKLVRLVDRIGCFLLPGESLVAIGIEFTVYIGAACCFLSTSFSRCVRLNR